MNEVIVTIVGNVVTEPQMTSTASGAALTTFRLASAERRFDREAGHYRSTDSVFLQVRCWRGMALNAASLSKGAPVLVQGRLRQRTVMVDGPDGPQKRTYVDLDANALGVDLARAAAPAAPAVSAAPAAVVSPEPSSAAA